MAETTEVKTARQLNDELLYTMYATFRARTDAGRIAEQDRDNAAVEAEEFLEQALAKDVYTRGTYDLAGFRSDADVLIWWTCPDPDTLQETFSRFRLTRLGRGLTSQWSAVGVHRPAEFNRNHIPAYVRRDDPRRYVCVYPYVRSLEWYLLPDYERKGMLAEHGIMGREYEDVRSNTVAAFGLGDYEWLLAFEADEPHRILDCLRHLRSARARLHTKIETPFFFGARKPVSEIVATLP